MKNLECIICKNDATFLMDGIVLQKYKIQYFKCNSCNCIFTEKPYWIEEAYNDSIAITDTGLLDRNIKLAEKLFNIFNLYFEKNIKVLDFAGGYGVLTRLLRDKGVDAYWQDKYTENILAKGFEFNDEFKPDVYLAFEVVEHLEDPLSFFKEVLSKTDYFFFTTALIPNTDFTSTDDWWYFIPETGQHVFFVSDKTLRFIADTFGFHYNYYDGIHVFSKVEFMKNQIEPKVEKSKNLFNRFFSQTEDVVIPEPKFVSKIWEDHLMLKEKLKG